MIFIMIVVTIIGILMAIINLFELRIRIPVTK